MNNENTLPTISPAADIVERADGFHIFVDMPGVSSEHLHIDLEENELTISGSYTHDGDPRLCAPAEFGGCTYKRVFTLSDMVNKDHIKANLSNGVLDLFLPKAESMRPRRIEIRTVPA